MTIQSQDIAINRIFQIKGDRVIIDTDNIDWYINNPELLEGVPLSIQMLIDEGCEMSNRFRNTVHIPPYLDITEKQGVFSVWRAKVHLVDIHYLHSFQALMRGLFLNVGKE